MLIVWHVLIGGGGGIHLATLKHVRLAVVQDSVKPGSTRLRTAEFVHGFPWHALCVWESPSHNVDLCVRTWGMRIVPLVLIPTGPINTRPQVKFLSHFRNRLTTGKRGFWTEG